MDDSTHQEKRNVDDKEESDVDGVAEVVAQVPPGGPLRDQRGQRPPLGGLGRLQPVSSTAGG